MVGQSISNLKIQFQKKKILMIAKHSCLVSFKQYQKSELSCAYMQNLFKH